jgi:signal peptidase II
MVVGLFVLLADQLLKLAVVETYGPSTNDHRRELLGDFLALEYAENRGMAFGLLQGRAGLVSILALVVVVFAVRAFRQLTTVAFEMAIGGGLIAGGAAGNLLDRVRLGYVIDFIAVLSWPNFNLADSAITVGALMIGWWYLRNEGKVSQPNGIGVNLA